MNDASTNIKSTYINIDDKYGYKFTLGIPISTTVIVTQNYMYNYISYIIYYNAYYIFIMYFFMNGDADYSYSNGNVKVYYI